MAYARLQYARKHFSWLPRLHLPRDPALPSRAAARAPAPLGETRSSSAPASALALRVLLGREKPPYRVRESAAPTPQTASVMGLPFHRLDARTLVRDFVEGARTGTGVGSSHPTSTYCASTPPTQRPASSSSRATHCVADGLPIVWASRLAGTPLPERVPGSDLVLALPQAAADAGLSVFLLGGNPGVAAAAARRLRPAIPDSGMSAPTALRSDSRTSRRRSSASARSCVPFGPDLVLVGLGFPKQEQVIRVLRPELPGAWFVGVGISLSFLAGDQPRAPLALQRLGLEWLHRLWHEPRRLFRRYIIQGLAFGARLLSWALRLRLR